MKKLALALSFCASLAALASTSHAAIIYAIDDSTGQTLITFDSQSPNALISGVAISGLQTNETIKAIDIRPATNQLYALGSTNRVYVINPITGATSQIGAGPFAPALNGSNFGFDFNPVIDRIRVVSNTTANYVLNPNDGTATAVTNLFFGAGDPNLGSSPNVSFSAYTNSLSPAPAATQLYGIDAGLDALVTQANSAGTLGTVGPLGINVGAVGGFDIDGVSGIAYATLLPVGSSVSNLYSINLTTGAATNLGQIDGGVIVSSMTVSPPGGAAIPEPASAALLAAGAVALLARKRRNA